MPPDRAGAFAALHAREGIELALFGGRSHHATAGSRDPGVPHRRVAQRDVLRPRRVRALPGGRRGTAGRVALPGRLARAPAAPASPFVLWSALWAHLRTPAHVARRARCCARIYRDADAVVDLRPARRRAYARAQGARASTSRRRPSTTRSGRAPGARAARRRRASRSLFVGRDGAREGRRGAACGLARERPGRPRRARSCASAPPAAARAGLAGEVALGRAAADASCATSWPRRDVLVVPSLPTRSFREPWGLVVNEAMHQGIPVIATDAVGAAAGGLVRDGRTGLVVPAGDAGALAGALRRLARRPGAARAPGRRGAQAVAAYTFEAWAPGFSRALAVAGAAASPC